MASDPPFLSRMKLNRDAKVTIATEAANIIGDDASVAIDAGSTSSFIALALQTKKNLTIVTNSAFVASTLASIPGNKVSMTGTQLRNHDGAAFDRSAFDVIERMQVDFVVLSASMVDSKKGFLVHEQCEIDIANAMFNISSCSIMAVDHSKFLHQDRKPTLRQPTLRANDVLITDKTPPTAFDEILNGIDTRLAKKTDS